MLIGRPLPIDVLHATRLVTALQVLTDRVYPSMGGPWSANTRGRSACRRAQPWGVTPPCGPSSRSFAQRVTFPEFVQLFV